ncbi:hypothetical protein RCOM_0838230 [Ricinus communis]|uniref:Trichome birefringence-like C-terminal domain-containing protein n=2 Tax=Ricinus communis TaxID=3988 RepID=B9SQN7_RICCO|nr:hypothetical protein RCOM_0838230 [Ricinus communis]
METLPITPDMAAPPNMSTDRNLFAIAANVPGSMKVAVDFLNITTLSEYRKEAHTSIYSTSQNGGDKLLSEEHKADPSLYADCLHWCLPGLPDTWNELLYASIVTKENDIF